MVVIVSAQCFDPALNITYRMTNNFVKCLCTRQVLIGLLVSGSILNHVGSGTHEPIVFRLTKIASTSTILNRSSSIAANNLKRTSFKGVLVDSI